MPLGLLISLSLKNVRRHGRRSLGTLVIMTVSMLVLNVLFGYIQANVDLIRDAFIRWGARGHLVIERPASDLARTVEGAGQQPVALTDQRRIESVLRDDAAVDAYARVLRVAGMVSNAQVTAIFAGIGLDVGAVRRIKGPAYEYDVVAGEPLWQASGGDAALLGQGLAAILGCNVPAVGFAPLRPGESPAARPFACPPSPVQLSAVTQPAARINAMYVTPVGIMDWGIREINDRLVALPLPQAQRLLDTTDVSGYRVLLKNGASLAAAQQRIAQALARAGVDAAVFKWSDRAAFYRQVRGILLTFFGFVVAIAVVVGFMSLFNASYMNFMRRGRELATLRSVGYGKGFVLALAGAENAWLAFAAATAGLLGAAAITFGVHAVGLSWTPPGSSNAVPIDIAWTPGVYAISAAALFLTAALTALSPVHRILHKPIHKALVDR